MRQLIKFLLSSTGCKKNVILIPAKRKSKSDVLLRKELLKLFNRLDHTNLPYGYMLSSDVLLLKVGHVCGGVLFCRNPRKFRTVSLSKVEFSPPPGSLEANGLCLDPDTPELLRLSFWLAVAYYISCLPDDTNIYFSYETHKSGLVRFYHSFVEEVVYSGEVGHQPGMDPDKTYIEEVCRFTPGNINIPELLARRLYNSLYRTCPVATIRDGLRSIGRSGYASD